MAAKNVTDFTKELADLVEERAAMIRNYVDENRAASRDELAKFVWSTAKKIFKTINPSNRTPKRKEAWDNAKGMLKEIIDFEKFHAERYHAPCIRSVLEPKVFEVLQNYHYYVLTGQVRTRHLPPKLLGETDELLCVDKPVNFTCSYGANTSGRPLPQVAGAKTPTQLLNVEKDTVQIHEYLALKFDYETALGTREFWAEAKQRGLKIQECYCGKCDVCACMQAGCCNRLDKETSGVMVAAKTKKGFPEIRKQFDSKHSLEEGGTEKYYFALVHGQVQIPAQAIIQGTGEDWKNESHESHEHGRRGRIEIAMCFNEGGWKAVPWNDGNSAASKGKGKEGKGKPRQGEDEDGAGGEPGDSSGKRLYAVTFYDPVAWFTNQAQEQFTLLHLQLVTGRTHQIRFHCSQIGFPIVGDCTYGAPQSDRDWAGRVFLHSYQTRFREPFTMRWFEATSPLPQDLGQLLCGLQLERVKDACPVKGSSTFLSRRQHASLKAVFKQYDASTKLLHTRDAPVNAEKILAAEAHEFEQIPQVSLSRKQDSQPGAWPSESSNSWGAWDQSQSSGWQESWQKPWSSPWATEPRSGNSSGDAQRASKQQEADSDSDEDWGKWRAPKVPKPTVPEPEPKRPRLELEAGQNGQASAPPPATAPPKAAWKRMESTRQAGVFYYLNMATNETQVEPPEPWQRQQSRRDPSIFFYWNKVTGQTSVEKPEL